MGEDLLDRVQLANGDSRHSRRVLAGEVGVDVRVVLAVVADEDPPDVGEGDEEVAQLGLLVLLA